jgi:cobyrinic acid a,c-diamide synthase
MSGRPVPRLVIAGTSSGVGKTTVTVGLAGALRARGLRVAVFKCGPDYLDPGYHARAAGVPSHNLDGWMMGRDAVLATFARASAGADVALIEGVMGLFDGASPTGEEGSSAEIAKWLRAPVLLVVDASGMARTIGAVAAGFASFDCDLHLAGLVCNRVGSRGHLDLLREAARAQPIVGGLPAETGLAFPERHLGLISALEKAVPQSVLTAWGERVAGWFDLERVVGIARSAPPLPDFEAPEAPRRTGPPCRIGIAFDEALHFYYEDNLRRLESLGATLVRFSPMYDVRLPDVEGLYLGGGYPEVHAEALSRNVAMREATRAFAAGGGPIYAECGGLMYLSRAIQTLDGTTHPMVDVVPGEAVMTPRLQALGYVEVETQAASILGPAGLRFRGHQFRYSDLHLLASDCIGRIYSVRRRGGAVFREGYQVRSVLASYVHAHWASNPLVAERLVEACAAYAGRRS